MTDRGPLKAEPLGFVVLDVDRYPMRLGRDGVLWIAHRLWTITAFATRKQAEGAIQLSNNYAARHGYTWGRTYHIVRMVPFLRTPRKQSVAKDGRGKKRESKPKVRRAGKQKKQRVIHD